MKKISFLNKIYIKELLNKIRRNINHYYYLNKNKRNNFSKTLVIVYVPTIKDKEKAFIGPHKYLYGISFLYHQIEILSQFSKNNLFKEKELINYLFLLNNFINIEEEKLDNKIIEVVSTYKKDKEKENLFQYIQNKIDFKEYEENYNKSQKDVFRFLKYFKNNVSVDIYDQYYSKLNLRTWNDMFLKIEERVNTKKNN